MNDFIRRAHRWRIFNPNNIIHQNNWLISESNQAPFLGGSYSDYTIDGQRAVDIIREWEHNKCIELSNKFPDTIILRQGYPFLKVKITEINFSDIDVNNLYTTNGLPLMDMLF